MHLKHYHISVGFYSFCLQRLKKEESANKKIFGIFKKKHLSSLTSKQAEMLLNKAIDVHDSVLKYVGQAADTHKCNNKPFRSKSIEAVQFASILRAIPLTVNISDMWYYKTKTPTTSLIPFESTESMVVEKLCRGGQVKVRRDKKQIISDYALRHISPTKTTWRIKLWHLTF